MKILVSWLRDFVDVTAPPPELGETLSMRGFELASVERTNIVPKRSDARTVQGSDHGSDHGNDAVLDFEITANRPDALSVIGIAREAATAYGLPLRHPGYALLSSGGDHGLVSVSLEAPDLCPRYAAAVADVSIGPSPAWLAARLQAAGVRPINNVVDVTNYVLIEMGQPMHAFDLEKLAGRQLRIRRAAKGERMRTLDGVDRALDPDMLVIADADKAQAVAGVMGGGVSEVSAATRTIVLESACFNPKSIRLTSKRLGLKTEASMRFERGTDINAPVPGLQHALALLQEIGAGRPRGDLIDHYPSPRTPRVLTLRHARIARVLGQEIAAPDVERILRGLGFEIQPAGSREWLVHVPSFRVDVAREVDLIEEVARHYGYDRLPSTFPGLLSSPPPPDPRIERDRLVRRVLLAAGSSEALTFSFIDAALAAAFADTAAIVPIDNPLSAQFSVLRPSLLPGLLASIAHNRNRQREDVSLFELGSTVTRRGETRRVGVAWTGEAATHWSGGRRPVDFFDAKGLVERIAHALQVEVTFDTRETPPYLAPGRAASVRVGNQIVGSVGMLTPNTVQAAGLSPHDDVYVGELELDALTRLRTQTPLKAVPLPRYPSIARDISIVVDQSLPAAAVRGTIRSVAPDTLVSVREFDRYHGKGVPENRVSLSLRLTFRSPERTLTDSEVEDAMKQILNALKSAHDAVQR